MPIDFQEADRWAAEQRGVGPAILTGSRRIPEDQETLSLVQQAGDVLAAPFRGIEGAAQDLYGLADALAFDALPDYEERVLGVSRTAVGGLVEGLVNFGVGFVGAEFLLPAKAFAGAGRLAPVLRGAAKGAIADFAVFDGNEQRLSDLVQAFPILQNPITEFLSSDPEDPEVLGRLKNVLEGLGVGAAVDSVALGLKALGIGRKARAAGRTEAELDALIDRAIPPDEFAAALRKLEQQEAGRGVPGTLGSPARPEAAEAPLEPVAPARLTEAVQSEPGYVYHATNAERLADIRESGELKTHRPDEFTDQDVWPDGSRQKRAYFSEKAGTVWQFAPESGTPVVLRRRHEGLSRESTGDIFSTKPIPTNELEYLGTDGNWHSLTKEGPPSQSLVSAPPPLPTGTEDSGVLAMRTLGIDEKQGRKLYEMTRLREAVPLEPRTAPRRMTEAERLAAGLQTTDLNLSRYRGPDGALQLLRAMEEVFAPLKHHGDAARRTLKQQEDTGLRELADIVGEGDRQSLMVRLQQDVGDIVGLNRRIIGYKTAMQSAAQDAYRLMQKATAATAGDKDMLEFLESIEFLHDVELGVKRLLGEQGRGLGANRIPTRYAADLFSLDEIRGALHDRGGGARALDLAKKFKILMDSEPDALAKTAKAADMARGLAGRRALGVLNSYWYNSLLGRPTTLVVAGLSTALTSIYRPLENILGGALTLHGETVRDGVGELIGLVSSAGEAWRSMVAALKGGGQLLDPRGRIFDVGGSKSAFAPEKFGVAPDSTQAAALRWIGNAVEWPSKGLNAQDELFKQLNYRAMARNQFTKDIRIASPGMSHAEVAEAVEAKLGQLIYRGQAYGTAQLYHRGVEDAVRSGLTGKVAVDEHARAFAQKALSSPEHARLQQISDLALQRANEVAFTTPLTPGTLPYRYQEAVIAHPILRLITPFVRTPTNVLKFAFDRNVNAMSGLAQLAADKTFGRLLPSLENSRNKLVQDMLSGDARRKAEAIGRLSMGGATTAFIIMKAAETDDDGRPLITGFGPADREQRRLLEADGWQQYSIRVGDKYVSYNRLDPFATVLGVAADVVNTVRYAMDEDQNAVEDMSLGFAVAIAHSLTNKTYLVGLANALDMIADPQRKFDRWAQSLAGTVVPGTAAAGVSVVDPVMRDVQSMVDAMRSRLPGASDNLPPLRNVLGEPVKRAQSLGSGWHPITNAFVPVLYREVSDDLVNKELAQLQHGFTPPKRERGGLDLTTVVSAKGQNAYDRWLELHGEVVLGGKTLRQALRRLITSPIYSKIPSKSTDELASPRIQMIQGVIEDYRSRAYRQLVREFPELAAADRARFRQRTLLRRGVESRPELLQALQPTPADAQAGTDAIVRAFRPGG